MARKKLRQIRFASKRKRRNRPSPGKTKATGATVPATAAASVRASQPTIFTRQDIVSKLIPLSVASAKEAQKTAHKAIDNVFSAMRHVLSEGDLTVDGFGRFKAGKTGKTGDIQVLFTPDEKLKQAVEARLNATS